MLSKSYINQLQALQVYQKRQYILQTLQTLHAPNPTNPKCSTCMEFSEMHPLKYIYIFLASLWFMILMSAYFQTPAKTRLTGSPLDSSSLSFPTQKWRRHFKATLGISQSVLQSFPTTYYLATFLLWLQAEPEIWQKPLVYTSFRSKSEAKLPSIFIHLHF